MSEKVIDRIIAFFSEPVPDAPVTPPVGDSTYVNKGINPTGGRAPVNPGTNPAGVRATANTGVTHAGADDPTVRLPSQPVRKQKEHRKWFRGSGRSSGGTYVAPQPAHGARSSVAGDRRARPYPDGSDVFPGSGANGAQQKTSYQIDDFADPVRSPSARSGRVINMQGSDIGMGPPIREYIPKKMEDKAKGTKMHYGEYKHVIDDFAAGNIIILNLQNLDTGADEEKNKVLCLIFGAIAAVDGYIYMLSDNIYLFAMGGVDVSGAIRQGRVGDYMPGL